jgi:hypothetical protein
MNLQHAGVAAFLLVGGSLSAQNTGVISPETFRNPPYEYRPTIPFEGAGSDRGFMSGDVREQLKPIYLDRGFGGIVVAPSSATRFTPKPGTPGPSRPGGLLLKNPPEASPWIPTAPNAASAGRVAVAGGMPPPPSGVRSAPPPAYLSKEYFDRLKQVLAYSKENGRKVVFYDEVGYPSGMANHTAPPELYRKILQKSQDLVKGPSEYRKTMPDDGVLMAVVAMNKGGLKRIDLTSQVKNKTLVWKAPAGEWQVMIFNCVTSQPTGRSVDYNAVTDYLDPDAIQWFLDRVYEPHAREVGEYFGNTINMTFFDDVGIYSDEHTWSFKFNEKFKARIGKDPAIYYPALWEDIGPETEAARVAFFDTRAELMADGFPKVITDWGAKHNLPVSGHCPGNYAIQPVDYSGDPFKYYRAQPIPLADVIYGYPFGREGFKLISDVGDLYDKPIVAAETFGGFAPEGLPAGYRRLMELYIRGITRLTGAGARSAVTGQAGSPSAFAEWAGRTSMLLQGGRRVSEVAILYPIAALEGFYHFDAADNPLTLRAGMYVPRDTDFLAVGEMLLNNVHRDYTLLHPDILLSDKVKVNGNSLDLENQVNRQSYKVVILPGGRVISLKALEKIKVFYESGGVVIATSLLPSKASELAGSDTGALANDRKVQAIVKTMFGIDSGKPMPEGVSAIKMSARDGKAVFVRKPDPAGLISIFEKLAVPADVTFVGNPQPQSGAGRFSYVHKNKEGKEIYFFANSTDDAVDTYAEVRGRIKPEAWNPYTGGISAVEDLQYIQKTNQDYTRFPLKLAPVSSSFVVAGGR